MTHGRLTDLRRTGLRSAVRTRRRRIEDVSTALAVGSEFEGCLEIVEGQVGGIGPVAERQNPGRRVVALREMPGVVVDADKIDDVGMSGVRRGAGEILDMASEAFRIVQ